MSISFRSLYKRNYLWLCKIPLIIYIYKIRFWWTRRHPWWTKYPFGEQKTCLVNKQSIWWTTKILKTMVVWLIIGPASAVDTDHHFIFSLGSLTEMSFILDQTLWLQILFGRIQKPETFFTNNLSQPLHFTWRSASSLIILHNLLILLKLCHFDVITPKTNPQILKFYLLCGVPNTTQFYNHQTMIYIP